MISLNTALAFAVPRCTRLYEAVKLQPQTVPTDNGPVNFCQLNMRKDIRSANTPNICFMFGLIYALKATF